MNVKSIEHKDITISVGSVYRAFSGDIFRVETIKLTGHSAYTANTVTVKNIINNSEPYKLTLYQFLKMFSNEMLEINSYYYNSGSSYKLISYDSENVYLELIAYDVDLKIISLHEFTDYSKITDTERIWQIKTYNKNNSTYNSKHQNNLTKIGITR